MKESMESTVQRNYNLVTVVKSSSLMDDRITELGVSRKMAKNRLSGVELGVGYRVGWWMDCLSLEGLG